MDKLTPLALEVNARSLALGNETFAAAGASFVRNRDLADIYDCNHAFDVTCSSPGEIDSLLERMEVEFAGFGHRRFDVDYRTPPQFVARLALDTYERSEGLVMVLEGKLQGPAPTFEIRPVMTDGDWATYEALHLEDWKEYRERMGRPADEHVAQHMARSRRLKQPPVQFWMAYVDGRPAGYMYSWEGVGGMGQVEDLFVTPELRKRGIATALIHHCVAAAREKGARHVAISADTTDTPKQIYARMGFRPVAVVAQFRRTE